MNSDDDGANPHPSVIPRADFIDELVDAVAKISGALEPECRSSPNRSIRVEDATAALARRMGYSRTEAADAINLLVEVGKAELDAPWITILDADTHVVESIAKFARHLEGIS